MIKLSVDQVLVLHSRLLERFGGTQGIRDRGALEAALERPFASFGDEDAHPTTAAKAAALLHGLATSHPFIDGNKRVALAATLIWLEVNEVELVLEPDVAEALVVGVASGSVGLEQLREVFERAV